MKPIAVLSIGQGASNIAVEMTARGYFAATMNLSGADLSAVKQHIPSQLQLRGEGGAAKNRELGLKAVMDNQEEIVSFLKRYYSDGYKALMVIFTLGGGTGSGAGPAVSDIAANLFPDLIVNPVVVLPDVQESAVCQYNAVDAYQFLSRSDRRCGAVFSIDNARGRVLYGQRGREDFYGVVNGMFAETIDLLLEIPSLSSTTSNLDVSEVFDLLRTPGGIGIYRANLPFEGDWSAVQLVRKSWEQSIFAQTEMIPTKAAVVVQHPGDLTFNPNDLFPVPPLALHEGIYPAGRKIVTICAGMPYPINRLRDIETSLAEARFRSMAPAQEYRPEVRPLTMAQNKPAAENDYTTIVQKYKR